jgi:pyrimidine-specific ribonucleoside hydrolase
MEMRKNILIDCDPGIDDSIALLMAFKSQKVNVVAVTTVFGNNGTDATTNNALRLNDRFGFHVDVYRGAEKPIFHPARQHGDFHGKDGLGSADFPAATSEAKQEYAWDVIYNEAKKYKGELTLVTLGPVTNVAIALFKYEDLKDYVKEIIMMAGSATTGNELPFSEANVVSDAYAMQVVLNSKIPLTMVGLNATETTRMTEAEFSDVFSSEKKIANEIRQMMTHYKGVQNRLGSPGCVIHDAAAMFVVLNRDAAEIASHNVVVELTRNQMFGRTVVDIRRHSTLPRNVEVVMSIDKEKYLTVLSETLLVSQ